MKNLLLILYPLFLNVLGEPCITPFGQIGKCVPIRSCSSLLWSFTNPKYGIDEHLQKFMCSNGDLGLMVCCHIASDYMVFENDEIDFDPDPITDIKTIINAKTCGTARTLVNPTGIAHLQDFPWLVKIMTVNNEAELSNRIEKVGCTGVLVNKLYVLCSAQCHNTILRDIDYFVQIDIYTNAEDCNESSYSKKCSRYEYYEVVDVTVHPFYDNQTKINDIAILTLSRRVRFSEYIRPICLPINSGILRVNDTLQTVGWNRTNYANDYSVKKIQSVTLISNFDCKSRLLTIGRNISISPYEMCTNLNENVNKDSIGLPLMSLHGNQWYLQGFEAYGDNIKVYTRVQNYLQWIEGTMGGERCLTPYNQTGECMDLSDCPKLMDASANISPNFEAALQEFICKFEFEDPDDETYVLQVCCNTASDFIIPSETVDNTLDFEVMNFKFCGLQHRDDYFSSSEDIAIDEFPWLAIILNATLPNQKDNVCGGTLITNQFVLTSGVCLFIFSSNDTILVRLGDYNLKNSSDCVKLDGIDLYDCNEVQEYGIEKEIIHPFFNEFTYVNDIALLKLNKKVTYTDYIRPICLPKSEDELEDYGATLFTTGFGEHKMNVEGTKIKKKIRTTLISNELCKEKLNLLSYIFPITPYHICTEDYKNSTDVTCIGDEGGPVMYRKKLKWFIAGISSSYACGDDEPQTHLNVYKYLKWIKSNIKA